VLNHRSDGPRNVQVDCIPHRTAEGKIPGCYMLIADITQQKAVERALRSGEERLRSIVSTAVDAIITLDRRGMIESVNSAAEEMFGHSSAEMVGQNIGLFVPVPDLMMLDRNSGESARSTMRRMIKSGREIHALRKDGSTFPVEVTVSDVGSLGLFTGILRDVSQRMELEREVLDATAAEQRRIGQELHDHIGQELTGLEMLVDTLLESVRTSRGSPQELGAKIASGLRKTHREVRALARGLIPVEIHPSGLREALEQLAARISEQGALKCRFRASGKVQVSDAGIATHMYRIAQEAIANSIRHGQPNAIEVRLRVQGAVLNLEIEDDGIGIEDSPVRAAGLGLRLMEYRASLISGTLQVERGETKGTKVICRVPQASYAPVPGK
jgi:PAS domain S-box-containing protein